MAERPSEEEREWVSEIGLRVKIARFRRRISQGDLAEWAAVSRVTLGSVERGEHAATAPTYRRIARALEIPLGVLLAEVDE